MICLEVKMRQLSDFMQRIKIQIKFLASYLFNSTFRATVRYAKNSDKNELKDNWVLFEVYRGEKMADTPYAMFLAMLEDERFQDFTYIWTVNDENNYYANLYKNHSKVKFCKRNSKLYVKALCQSKYVINNKAFPSYFIKREGQIHASTWHATAFKALGKHQGGTMGQFKNVTRNYAQTDFLIMPNRFTSDIMLSSNDVQGIFPGYVVEEGYPRNDLTINTKREDIMKLLKSVLPVDEFKKVVLYAPTWRGETGSYMDITKELLTNVKQIEEKLGDEYELLLKVHDLTAQFIKNSDEHYDFRIVPDWIDTNEVLNAVDILITDYSSIFIDFLVLDRPVIFYTYDLDEYIKDRGLYFDMNNMPGPNCATADEVVEAITHVDEIFPRYKDLYQKMKEEFCSKEDGNASKRVNDIIFFGKKTENMYRSLDANKKKIIIISNLDDKNGENAQIIEFSNQLDYEHYDLTILLTGKVTRNRTYVLKSLHKNTRVFYNMGIWNLAYKEYVCSSKFIKQTSGHGRSQMLLECRQAFLMQYKRLVGMVSFDIGIVFGKKMTPNMGMLLMSDVKTKISWLTGGIPEDLDVSDSYLLSMFDRIWVMDEMKYQELNKLAQKKKQESKIISSRKFVNISLPLKNSIVRANYEFAFCTRQFPRMLTWANKGKKIGSDTTEQSQMCSIEQLQSVETEMNQIINQIEEKHGRKVDAYNKQIIKQLITCMSKEKNREDK